MTERIDLDELDTGDEPEADGPNPGDWFWRGDGDPEDEPDAVAEVRTDPVGDSGSVTEESEAASAGETDSRPMPRVPRENEDRPVGVPVESGGAGGAPAGADERRADDGASAPEDTGAEEESEASGPHGGGADDMTLAFTYEAAKRFGDFGLVAADAYGWADWVGLVGRVPAHVVNKFQRDHEVDLDFFNGASADPGERLARIDRHSMFYAERMVVVGVEGEDEEIAEKTGWEFVPLSEAAEKAGWNVER